MRLSFLRNVICFFRRHHFIGSREATVLGGLFVTQIGEDEARQSDRVLGERTAAPYFNSKLLRMNGWGGKPERVEGREWMTAGGESFERRPWCPYGNGLFRSWSGLNRCE